MTTFDEFELRANDVGAARAFYTRLLGAEPTVTALPARARERGAPPHWLGSLRVPRLDAAVAQVIARGGATLGPVSRARAVCRDPGGAVFGLSEEPTSRAPGPFVWHELHTDDVGRAFAFYEGLARWRPGAAFEGPVTARLLDGADGAILETLGRVPGIHPHWLFYGPVEDLARAVAFVREAGGRVGHGPVETPGGRTIAVCEDPEGAAFGLQRAC